MKKILLMSAVMAFVGLAVLAPSGYAMEHDEKDGGVPQPSFFNVDKARTHLSSLKVVRGRDGWVNISEEDPQKAIEASKEIFKYGIPPALEAAFKEIKLSPDTIDPHLIDTYVDFLKIGCGMLKAFKKGYMYFPEPVDLMNKFLTLNIQKVYDRILNTFLWEDGHTTEVTPSEVAAYFITREQLKWLKSFWSPLDQARALPPLAAPLHADGNDPEQLYCFGVDKARRILLLSDPFIKREFVSDHLIETAINVSRKIFKNKVPSAIEEAFQSMQYRVQLGFAETVNRIKDAFANGHIMYIPRPDDLANNPDPRNINAIYDALLSKFAVDEYGNPVTDDGYLNTAVCFIMEAQLLRLRSLWN
ncbi:MAG: hypothetical protein K0R76_1502 [Alphaproteobacteria bacterium]|jgi:hypothetical protein|nr:hypothetical protein [Alphaproteobacteria bacterium]